MTKRILPFLLVLGFLATAPLASHAQDAKPAAAEAAKAVTPFAHKNSKGNTYYLYSFDRKLKNGKTYTNYFFAKSAKNEKGTPLAKVPETHQVSETKNGLPVLKKKVPAKKG